MLSWCELRGVYSGFYVLSDDVRCQKPGTNAKFYQESISDASITMKLGTVVLFTIDRLARLRGRRCGDGAPERPYHATGLGVASEESSLGLRPLVLAP